MTSSHIVAVAQDPGGAIAILPVLRALARKSQIQISILARQHACQVFDQAGLSFQDCDTPLENENTNWLEFARKWLRRYSPDVVLTATSLDSGPDRGFIRATRLEGIPCIVILDSWTNYHARFLEPGESQLTTDMLPEIVGVIDSFSADEMIRYGVPEDRLRVVGQPDFDHFVDWASSTEGLAHRNGVRTQLGVTQDERLVVFFSQPISEMYGPEDSPVYRGYNESIVLELLLASISSIHRPIHLAIKMHPKEAMDKFASLLYDNKLSALVVEEQGADDLIMAADLVVGMTSIALVRAALANRPVLSIQPNLKVEDALVLGRMGILKPVTDSGLVSEYLWQALEGRDGFSWQCPLPSSWTDNLATRRVLLLIEGLMKGNQGQFIGTHKH